MTHPPSPSQPGEQVAMQDVLDAYRDMLAEAHNEMAILRGVIKSRDRTIEELRSAPRELPDVPHN